MIFLGDIRMAYYRSRVIKGKADASATGSALIDMNNIRKYAAVTKHAGGWRYSTKGKENESDEVVEKTVDNSEIQASHRSRFN